MKRYKYSVLAGLVIAVGAFSFSQAAYAAETGGTVVAAAQSADNSLSQLSISGAELSPDFYYSTVKYTATVPYEVTEVEVTARTSNALASIVSISGYENLAVGENTIKVVVAAENGNEATYTVTLTRLAEEEAAGSDAPESEPEESEPEAAEGSAAEPEDGESAPSEEEQEPVQISYGDYGLAVVNPPEGQVPDSMEQVSLEIDGTEVYFAYQYVGERVSTEEDLSPYYFLYGTDSLDATGWFMYDSRVGNFQRFIGQFLTSGEDSGTGNDAEPDTGADTSIAEDTVGDEYAQLLANYNTATSTQKQLEQKIRLMTAVFLFIVAILLIIMFSILWTKRNDDLEDGEVFDDEDEPIKKERPLETISVEREPSGRGHSFWKPEEPENLSEESDSEELPETTKPAADVAKTDSQKEESAVESAAGKEPEVEKSPEGTQKTGKKKKRRDSLLAYLGLDDDLPLDYGEVIEDEEEEESGGAEESTGRFAAKEAGDNKAGKTNKAASGGADENRGDDIEFIDL